MAVLDYIKQRFSYIGEISDAGASDFAVDFEIKTEGEMTDEMKKTISVLIDGFIERNILHPTSMSEGGVSISYGTDAIKNHGFLMLKKYGITLNDEASALVGFSVIKDVSNLW